MKKLANWLSKKYVVWYKNYDEMVKCYFTVAKSW